MKESGEIQMYVRQLIKGVPSGRNPRDFVVIRFSGDYRPHNIEDIPSVVFEKDKDEYALASVKDRVATFVDTTTMPYMYVTADKSQKDQAVYVLFPFSHPAFPVNVFLDVKYIGEKIAQYVQRVNPNYPVFAVEYIPGFLRLQREVDIAEQRAVQKFQTAASRRTQGLNG